MARTRRITILCGIGSVAEQCNIRRRGCVISKLVRGRFLGRTAPRPRWILLFENLLEIKIRIDGQPDLKISGPRKPAAFTFSRSSRSTVAQSPACTCEEDLHPSDRFNIQPAAVAPRRNTEACSLPHCPATMTFGQRFPTGSGRPNLGSATYLPVR